MTVFIIFIIAVFTILSNLNTNYYGEKIRTAPSTEKAQGYRRVLKQNKILLAFLYAIVFFLVNYIKYAESNEIDGFSKLLIAVGLIAFYFMFVMGKNDFGAHAISTYTKEEYLAAHPQFALYLRAFITDEYYNKDLEF